MRLSSASVVTPGCTIGDEKVQRFGGEPSSTSHALEGLGPVELDFAGLAASALRSFDERHQVIRIAPSKPYQMGQTGAPRKVHECRDTFAQCCIQPLP